MSSEYQCGRFGFLGILGCLVGADNLDRNVWNRERSQVMQAIVTKYLCPTNHRGARIKATAQAGSITVPWAYELDVAENHINAAKMLRSKLDWGPSFFSSGQLPNGDFAHVVTT